MRDNSTLRSLISLRLLFCKSLMRILMTLLSRNFSSSSTESAMMMRILMQEGKADCSADSLIVLKTEIQNLNKTFSNSIKMM